MRTDVRLKQQQQQQHQELACDIVQVGFIWLACFRHSVRLGAPETGYCSCLTSYRLTNDLSLVTCTYDLPDALARMVRPLIILARKMRELKQTCSANSFTTICTRSSNSCLVFFFCFLIVSTMPEFGPRFHSNSLSTFKKITAKYVFT